MTQPLPEMTRAQFLTSAALFEGALLGAAFLVGWLVHVNPTATLSWSREDAGFGILATLPMLAVMAACLLSRSSGMVAIRRFLRDSVGPRLDECNPLDLLLLALLAGVCEEVMFRGLIYEGLRNWNPFLAVLICNLLFGLAHAVTQLYALLAALIGLYLTALMASDPTPNLLIPMIAHTLYDLVGFMIVIRDYRQRQAFTKSEHDASTDQASTDQAGTDQAYPDQDRVDETPEH